MVIMTKASQFSKVNLELWIFKIVTNVGSRNDFKRISNLNMAQAVHCRGNSVCSLSGKCPKRNLLQS
jgi:hypothetical protein